MATWWPRAKSARFALDEVVFVPTGEPWQKSERRSAAEDRYLMTVIATAANPRFTVSRVDIDRDGPTYTIDTLRELHAVDAGDDLLLHHGRRRVGAILTWRTTTSCSNWRTSSASPGRATR